jgi:hydroxypyruvate isomerase
MMIGQGRQDTMQGTVNASAQLKTATALNRRTVAILAATNDKHVSQMEESQAYVKTLKDETSALKAKIKAA